jgi:hypothetical protein
MGLGPGDAGWQPLQQRGLLELIQALQGGKAAPPLLSCGLARAGPCVGRGVAGSKFAEHPRGQLAPRGKRVGVGERVLLPTLRLSRELDE